MKTIEPSFGSHISEVAKDAIAIVQRDGEPVRFVFNDVELTVTGRETAGDVCREYQRISDERHAEYIASPEYKESRRKAEEAARLKAERLAALLAKAPASLTLRDADTWKKGLANNSDPYGAATYRYAAQWARVMEAMMADGATLKDCAEDASHVADDEGITGFMYGCAVQILAAVWVHGNELRIWHNGNHGVSEERAKGGTVNPAVLSVG